MGQTCAVLSNESIWSTPSKSNCPFPSGTFRSSGTNGISPSHILHCGSPAFFSYQIAIIADHQSCSKEQASPTGTSSVPSAILSRANDVCPRACESEGQQPPDVLLFSTDCIISLFFDQNRNERDAPLKQDMVEVVGWISDAQKVAMDQK